jgi:DNA-binding MarR family transcriptional regulator
MKKVAIEKQLKIDPVKLNAYSTGLLQGKAYRILNSSLTKVLFHFDLSIPEWKLLGQLYDHGEMKLASLAERLDVEAPLVTALIDKLEKKELVLRTHHPKDKRAKIITVTGKGKKVIEQIEPRVKEAMAGLLKGVSREQLRMYMLILQTIVNNALKK